MNGTTTPGDSERELHILHFNDVYNIEASEREPAGGAARFTHKVKSFAGLKPLVLFSGDAFNPSIMSTLTRGKQMVEALNLVGVHAACLGNHDLDHGVDTLEAHAACCTFPWLAANILDRTTGEPLCHFKKTVLLDWEGLKVGLVGLVEYEWITTLATLSAGDVTYLDFVSEGRRLASQLRAGGADVVIALTHCRLPNDRLLAASAPEIDLVLGGHDHDYIVETISHNEGPGATLLVKSGTDFRDLTHIRLSLVHGNGTQLQALWERHAITRSVPEDPAAAALVHRYTAAMGHLLAQPMGETLVALDARFGTVRTRESNLGNWVADVWRDAARADMALLNSGTLRADAVFPPGPLTLKALLEMLPMMDETVVLELSGTAVVEALENGVAMYPKLEGRFLQVSGVKFSFDPSQAPGHRVVAGSVWVGDEEACRRIQPQALYRVALKAYMAQGKDGFTSLIGARVVVDQEHAPLLPTVVRNVFTALAVLNRFQPKPALVQRAISRMKRALDRKAEAAMAAGAHVSHVALRDPATGRYGIAPAVDGRIACVGPSCLPPLIPNGVH